MGNATAVIGLPDAQELALGNFFGACRPGSDGSLSIAVTAFDDHAPQTGLLPNGATTNDRPPTLSLTLDAVLGPGETLVVARDGAPIRCATSGGTTTVTDATLATGPHTDSASIADGAGNSTVLALNGTASGTAFLLTVGRGRFPPGKPATPEGAGIATAT
jgi:hypothetical protein